MPIPTPPSSLADDLRQLTARELSLPSRLRYVGLLLAASTMTAMVTALLLTEPALPKRTSIALGVAALIGVTWMVFAIWVLTRKRVLLGSHRIVAGRLAITFSTVFVIGAVFVGFATSSNAAFAAAAMGALMLAVAMTMLIRARRRFAELSTRRDELEGRVGRR
jgi:membrane associated rhomboid family serine protease